MSSDDELTEDTYAADLIGAVWLDGPDGVVPTYLYEGGGIDAMRVGESLVHVAGGELAQGPTMWRITTGTRGPILGTFIPHGLPTYYDTTDDARRALIEWMDEHTTAKEGATHEEA